MHLSTADGVVLSDDEVVYIFPPSFSIRGLWGLFLQEQTDENMTISLTRFRHIFLTNLPHIRFSKAERRAFDICMVLRHKLRMVDETLVQHTAKQWTDNLLAAAK